MLHHGIHTHMCFRIQMYWPMLALYLCTHICRQTLLQANSCALVSTCINKYVLFVCINTKTETKTETHIICLKQTGTENDINK